jgi:hypothetical protein
MNFWQKTAIQMVGFILILGFLFPPWETRAMYHMPPELISFQDKPSPGPVSFLPLWDPHSLKSLPENPRISVSTTGERIAWDRLAAEIAALLVAGGLIATTFVKKKAKER